MENIEGELNKKPYTLLYLDDDPLAISHMQSLLKQHQHWLEPSFWGSPQKAMESFRNNPADIVISDLRLGTHNGLEVISQMRIRAPDTVFCLISGDADLDAALTAINDLNILKFFVKPLRDPAFTTGLQEMSAHLNRGEMLGMADITQSTLDHVNLAILSVNVKMEVVFANSKAREIINKQGALKTSKDGRLISATRDSTSELHDNIREIFLSPTENPASITCTDDIDENRLVVYPVNTKDKPQGQLVTLMVIDPKEKKNFDVATLSSVMGLSMGEARIVMYLAQGHSLEIVAQRANLSLSTVRTYLKNAYAKTGVSRQSEIVSLAFRSSI